jgi:glycosyltransferase 2 family protein
MKTKVSITAGLAVSAGLLFLAFRNIEFGKLTGIYSSVSLWYLIPFVGVTLVELALRGLRWKLLLDPATPVRPWDVFRLETAGLALNNVLPLRLGEIVRGTFGAGLFGIPVMTVLATILVERALDTIVLVLLAVLAARFGGITGGVLGYGGYFWALFGGILACLLALVFLDEIISHHLFAGFFRRFPRLTKGLEHLALGVRAFHSPVNAAAILALAVSQWILDALNFYIIAAAFGLAGVLTFFKCMVLLLSVAAVASIPGVPGGFGNFEFAVTRVAGSWGVNGAVAFAYAAFLHIVSYVLVTVVGLVFVYQMGQSLGKVWAQFSGKKKDPGSKIPDFGSVDRS